MMIIHVFVFAMRNSFSHFKKSLQNQRYYTVKHCPVVQQDKKVRKKAMKYISMPNDPDSCPNIKVTDSENDTD